MNRLVKPPPHPTADVKNYPKALFAWREAFCRYHSRDSRNTIGFGNYSLERDGLVGVHRYGAGTIDRIVRDRRGSAYLMGIEIEIEGTTERVSEISETLQQYLPDKHICVYDGSLDSTGLEIVTAPFAPSEIGKVTWYRLVRRLSRLGCRAHDGDRAGLHVSISREYLRGETWNALRRWIVKQKLLLFALSRRTRESYAEYTLSHTKYAALNLTKGAVGEFRLFRGTLKPSSFLASIEIVRSLVEFARGEQDRADKKGSRVRISNNKRWIELVKERFPNAHRYIGDRYNMLVPSSVRSGGGARARRPNRTAEELSVLLSQELLRVGGASWARNAPEGIEISPSRYCFRESLPVNAMLPEPITYSVPINWERSTLPNRVRELISRGACVPSVTIRSRVTSPCLTELRVHYVRGGWGRSSYYRVEVAPSLED